MTIDGRKARPVSRKLNLVVERPPPIAPRKRRKPAATDSRPDPETADQVEGGEQRGVIDGPRGGRKPSRRPGLESPDEWPAKPDSLAGQVDCLVGLLATGQFGRGDSKSLAEAWGMSLSACRRVVLQAQLVVRRAIPDDAILELCTGSLVEAVDSGGSVGVRAAQVLLASRGLLKQVVDQTTHHDLSTATTDQLRDRLTRAMARARESSSLVAHSDISELTKLTTSRTATSLLEGATPRLDSGDDPASHLHHRLT